MSISKKPRLATMESVSYTPIPREHFYQGVRFGEIFTAGTLDRISALELQESDTVIIGFPKSGTTWLQEIIWLIQNDVNIEAANQKSVWSRIPLIESAPPGLTAGIDAVLQQGAPRLLKSHLPVKFWKEQVRKSGAKVIVVMRNPKDNLVSYYHFINMVFPESKITWQQWFDNFKLGETTYDGWINHVHDWFTEFKDDENVLFVQYEDIKADTLSTIDQLAKFLSRHLSEADKKTILDHTAFQNMQKNPATNLKNVSFLNQEKVSFQRKGKVGDWKNYFTKEQSDTLEQMCREKLDGIGLEFKYE